MAKNSILGLVNGGFVKFFGSNDHTTFEILDFTPAMVEFLSWVKEHGYEITNVSIKKEDPFAPSVLIVTNANVNEIEL